jgi:hypothetical protein
MADWAGSQHGSRTLGTATPLGGPKREETRAFKRMTDMAREPAAGGKKGSGRGLAHIMSEEAWSGLERRTEQRVLQARRGMP